jgi:hypothetical protein
MENEWKCVRKKGFGTMTVQVVGVFKFSDDTPDMGVAIIWLVVV